MLKRCAMKLLSAARSRERQSSNPVGVAVVGSSLGRSTDTRHTPEPDARGAALYPPEAESASCMNARGSAAAGVLVAVPGVAAEGVEVNPDTFRGSVGGGAVCAIFGLKPPGEAAWAPSASDSSSLLSVKTTQ